MVQLEMNRSLRHRITVAVLFSCAVADSNAVARAGAELRPMTTDRPDLTESPFTVNAGVLQVESTLVGYAETHTDREGIREKSFEFATINVRLGLTENSELNVAWQPFGTTALLQPSRTHTFRDEGVGSLQIRTKVNLFGNDHFDHFGDSALALLPFVTIPTDRNNGISVSNVEGGLIIPFAVVLPSNFGLGLNAGVSAVNDGNGYEAEVFLSAALAHEWSSRFGTYYEIAAALRPGNSRADVILFGTGFTYALDDDTQLDGGINFGITDASDRLAPFVGLTRRF